MLLPLFKGILFLNGLLVNSLTGSVAPSLVQFLDSINGAVKDDCVRLLNSVRSGRTGFVLAVSPTDAEYENAFVRESQFSKRPTGKPISSLHVHFGDGWRSACKADPLRGSNRRVKWTHRSRLAMLEVLAFRIGAKDAHGGRFWTDTAGSSSFSRNGSLSAALS